MKQALPAIASPPLELLPYQSRLVEFLRRHDADVWNWFAAAAKRGGQAEEQRFELLKSAYRIDRGEQASLYEMADKAAGLLGLAAPITIYQAQDPAGLNASLAYLPDEIHVVLHGPLATQLSPTELCGLLGHELSHFLLWQHWDGELLVAERMLAALTNDSRAHPAHFASWRLLKLYNEIVCDRGSLLVTGDMRAVVSMLVKVQTGVTDINPDSYLRQADEIFAHGPARTEGLTHPEAFIRARAIKLFAENDPQAEGAITHMIEAGTDLNELDLLGQQRMAGWTRRVIDVLLSHKWFQSEAVLAHARLYFDDYEPPADPLTDPELARDVRLDANLARDYFCYVLLDFVSADRDLDEPALAAALQLAEDLDIKERLLELARQELRLRKSQLEKLDDTKAALLQEADRAAAAAP